MIIRDKGIGRVKVVLGEGDITIGLTSNKKDNSKSMCFFQQNEPSNNVTTMDIASTDSYISTKESPVELTFKDVRSVDVLIEQLFYVRYGMMSTSTESEVFMEVK